MTYGLASRFHDCGVRTGTKTEQAKQQGKITHNEKFNSIREIKDEEVSNKGFTCKKKKKEP